MSESPSVKILSFAAVTVSGFGASFGLNLSKIFFASPYGTPDPRRRCLLRPLTEVPEIALQGCCN